jgi:hypothetical protein
MSFQENGLTDLNWIILIKFILQVSVFNNNYKFIK